MGVGLLTDGISSSGWVAGNSEWTKAKPVFSSHPKQVVLTLQQSWHHEGLAGTGCVDLKQLGQTLSGNLLQYTKQKSLMCCMSIKKKKKDRKKIDRAPYLSPGFVSHTLLLNKVALDSLPSIIVRKLPDQPHGVVGDVSDSQVLGRPRNI